MSDFGDVLKQGGYVVSGINGSVPRAVGYSLLSPASSVTKRGDYVVIANPPSVMKSLGYVITDIRSAVPTQVAYVVQHSFYPPHYDLTLDYPFIEERFPECVSFGSQGGPGFRTSVFTFDSGITSSEVEWDRIRARYEATFENATPADIEELESFFYGVKGKAIGFRYKDWSDYQISSQNMAIGDGTSRTFQVFKRYQSGGHVFDRIIKKTVKNTTEIVVDGVPQVEGVDYYMLDAFGQIVFVDPLPQGAIATVNYLEYDVPVRFDTDYLDISYEDFRQLNASVPLIEILL